MERKGLIMVITITIILGLMISGCTTDKSAGAKEMKISWNAGPEPGTLDPQMSIVTSEQIIEMNLFEGLMRFDKDNIPQLAIASSIDVSADGLTYTIKLKDTKYSNGESVTAEDFKESWLHALAPETASEYAYQLFYLKNGEAYNANQAKVEDVGIRVVDSQTLVITLEAPTPYFKSLLAFPIYYPVNQKNAQNNKTWYTEAESYVGNGPFKMKSWTHNDKIVLVKNERYWDAANVKLTELIFSLVEDGKAAATAFEAGQLDGTSNVIPQDIERFRQLGLLKSTPSLATYYYQFNLSKKPLNDPKVRLALSLAINRQDLVDHVFRGGETPAYALVPDGIPDVGEGLTFRQTGGDYFKEDIAKAKQLLAEAGYPEGKGFPELSILYNSNGSHQLAAQAIQDFWRINLGIHVKLIGQEGTIYMQNMQNKQFDIGRAGFNGDYVDPMTFLDIFKSNGGNNQTGWSNVQYDKDIENAKNSADQKLRMEAMHDAERILMTEMPVMPIYFYVNHYIIKPNIHNVTMSPLGYVDFKYATVNS